jgi:hypothetical protein
MTDHMFIHANAHNGSGLSIKFPSFVQDKALKTIIRFFVNKGEVIHLYDNDYYNPNFNALFDGDLYNTSFQVGIEKFRDSKFPAFSYNLVFSGKESDQKWDDTINEIFDHWCIANSLEKLVN